MLKIKKFVSVNRIFAVFFAIIMLFSVTFATNSFFKKNEKACVFSEKTYYFSDASKTTIVGYSGYFCDRTFFFSGKKTHYTEMLYCECNEDIK